MRASSSPRAQRPNDLPISAFRSAFMTLGSSRGDSTQNDSARHLLAGRSLLEKLDAVLAGLERGSIEQPDVEGNRRLDPFDGELAKRPPASLEIASSRVGAQTISLAIRES